jgi:antirestriction protein ArdC
LSVDEIDRHIKTEETMKQDLHAEVTARIVAQLETGVRPWMRPWTTGESVAGRPLRATGEPYRGINTLILWEASLIRGYHAPTWVTFRQARAEGGTVRRGERGTTVVYSSALTRADVDPETGEEAETRIPFLKSYTVFNVEQCDGLPDRLTAPLPACPEPERIAAAEAFIAATGARIEAGGGRAFYAPARDMIGMPARTAFRDAHGWYATLLHELTHWTGHPARCHRQFGRRFADQAYAREELVVRRVGANKGVKTCLLDSWENPCVPDLPVPVMNRLKSRKGNGTIACREKAQTAEAIVGRAGHRKVRTAKATLPELQSPGFYPRQRRSDGCSVAPCRNRFAHENRSMKGVWQPSAPSPVGTACPPSVGSKGRTERLTASHLLVRVNTGSPKWARQRPTWRQSRHSSQMPGVMPRTAIFGWTTTDESYRATGAGFLTGRVKGGSACETGQPTGWAC